MNVKQSFKSELSNQVVQLEMSKVSLKTPVGNFLIQCGISDALTGEFQLVLGLKTLELLTANGFVEPKLYRSRNPPRKKTPVGRKRIQTKSRIEHPRSVAVTQPHQAAVAEVEKPVARQAALRPSITRGAAERVQMFLNAAQEVPVETNAKPRFRSKIPVATKQKPTGVVVKVTPVTPVYSRRLKLSSPPLLQQKSVTVNPVKGTVDPKGSVKPSGPSILSEASNVNKPMFSKPNVNYTSRPKVTFVNK
jgi:hypothetical protein